MEIAVFCILMNIFVLENLQINTMAVYCPSNCILVRMEAPFIPINYTKTLPNCRFL